MRIALIGHSYHKRTRSIAFFLDLLRRLGRVRIFFDETWLLKRSAWIDSFDPAAFDCIVIWQVHQAFDYIREPHPNLVFVPMYDQMANADSFFWTDAFNQAKVLCFSAELYRQVRQRGGNAAYFQYFPDPSHYPATVQSGLSGFFWMRVPSIDPDLVARLCEGVTLDRFTIHNAPDPMSGAELLPKWPVRARLHQRMRWKKSHQDYLDFVAQHNLFFAPRLREGIGMSFLEAMAMGLCVVAPDAPTHSEYIVDGVNGLLYDPLNPRALNFDSVNALGARARECVETGFLRWSSKADELLNFIASPSAVASASDR